MISTPISTNNKPKRPAWAVVISGQRLWRSSSLESAPAIPRIRSLRFRCRWALHLGLAFPQARVSTGQPPGPVSIQLHQFTHCFKIGTCSDRSIQTNGAQISGTRQTSLVSKLRNRSFSSSVTQTSMGLPRRRAVVFLVQPRHS